MKRPRYQFGTLYLESRRKRPDVWVYRWREVDEEGKRSLRKQIIGTVREYRSRDAAQRAVEAIRVRANQQESGETPAPPTLLTLIEHYRLKEMPMDTHEDKTRGTKLAYKSVLNHHVVPRWGHFPLRRVTTIQVEEWLKSLPHAPGTKAKIRNVMSMLFRHAIRWGWLGQHENPIVMVRVSTQRKREPVPLTAEEFRALFRELSQRERVLGTICATTGLRIGEVLGLKWQDLDFAQKIADVLRSFVDGSVGRCKTEVSRQPVPLDDIVIEALLAWRATSCYAADEDWVFASDHHFGKTPLWPDSIRSKILQPAARRAGITKRVGWHTFRHTYSSLLAASGNEVKVVQELMRHAKLSTTMEVYTHARMETKRVAQRKAVDVLFARPGEAAGAEGDKKSKFPNVPRSAEVVPGFCS
jgi:integrase